RQYRSETCHSEFGNGCEEDRRKGRYFGNSCFGDGTPSRPGGRSSSAHRRRSKGYFGRRGRTWSSDGGDLNCSGVVTASGGALLAFAGAGYNVREEPVTPDRRQAGRATN